MNELLENLNIAYTNEYAHHNFSFDNYLYNDDLYIEVMGDYWHANPMKYSSLKDLNQIQLKDIRRDYRKQKSIQEEEMDILYLRETDIKKIQSYVKR